MDLKTIEQEIAAAEQGLESVLAVAAKFSFLLPAPVGLALTELQAFIVVAPTMIADVEKLAGDVEAAYASYKAKAGA